MSNLTNSGAKSPNTNVPETETPKKDLSDFKVPRRVKMSSLDRLASSLGDERVWEGNYNQAVLELREKFPTIPEDLTNRCVTIRYKQDNWIYYNIILYSDGLVVPKINGKNISIDKIKGERRWFATSYIRGFQRIERFHLFEFNQWIEKIIENADKCEVKVVELEPGTRTPIKWY